MQAVLRENAAQNKTDGKAEQRARHGEHNLEDNLPSFILDLPYHRIAVLVKGETVMFIPLLLRFYKLEIIVRLQGLQVGGQIVPLKAHGIRYGGEQLNGTDKASAALVRRPLVYGAHNGFLRPVYHTAFKMR